MTYSSTESNSIASVSCLFLALPAARRLPGGLDTPTPSGTSPAGALLSYQEGKSTISDLAWRKSAPVRRPPKGSGEAVSLTREGPHPAIREVVDERTDVMKALLVDGRVRGASVVERK